MSEPRIRFLAALVAPVALACVVAGLLSSARGLERERERTAAELELRARTAAESLAGIELVAGREAELDALADRLAGAAQARVTLVGADGRVLGDSRVPLERLGTLDDHSTRPELAAALGGRVGRGQRHSATVGQTLLYVAAPLDGPAGGAVRLALPRPRAAPGAWEPLGLAAVAGGVLAVALALALSAWARRPLARLRALTDAIAAGDLSQRLPRHQPPEIDAIARAIQGLAGQLSTRLAESNDEKERLRAVLDGMLEALLVVDSEGEIVLANDRLREFFGISGPLTGRTALEGIRNAELAELLLTAHAKGEPVSATLHVRRPTVRVLRVQAVRFPAGGGESAGTVAVFHDVTELSQLEKMRRDFVANASHELRTPLAAIRGFAETLLGSPALGESDRHNYLEIIDRHARRLGVLVDDLLELSRIESGQSPLTLGNVEVGPIAVALLRESAGRLEERGLTATHEVEEDTFAWADASAVEQILTNLLDNAIKYTEPGGEIHVTVRTDDRVVRVEVGDTGLGIPEADQGRIFERFYRVDKARSRAAGGTGLGLAIVKHLVQGMEGSLSVESTVGEGSRFRFTLPRP